jgi:hypothetical protein
VTPRSAPVAESLHFNAVAVTVPAEARCIACEAPMRPGRLFTLVLYAGEEQVAITCISCMAEYGVVPR